MGGEWRVRKIGTFAKAKGGKRLPKSIALQTEKNNHPYIRVVDFTDGKIHQDSLLYVPNDAISAIQRYRVAANDVIISIVGTIGAIAQVPQELHGANLTENAAKLYFTEEDVDASYVAYYLKSSLGQHEITINTVGSTQPKLPLYGIENINVALPPLKEQQAIACVLGSLDDKIELNRKMNQTLEEMARAIFKSWFVDFDPVRAKAAVRREHPNWTNEQVSRTACPKLKPEIAELFPDAFEDSELGEIPKGWEVKPLPELIEVNPTRTLRKGEFAPYLDMANMPTRGHSPDTVTERPFGSGMRFVNGDTLVARITPCLENGKTAFVDFLTDGQVGWGSTEYIVLRPKPPLPVEFAYCLARSDGFRDFAIQRMTGSSGRQRVPAELLAHFRLVDADRSVTELFGRLVQPLFARAGAATRESRILAALRDALLPKLISGELRVKDAEKFVERMAI